jgi:hypothetical protein
MKYVKFIDGGTEIYIDALMIYKFEQMDDDAIAIFTDNPDNSVYEVYHKGGVKELLDRINANNEYEIINCIPPFNMEEAMEARAIGPDDDDDHKLSLGEEMDLAVRGKKKKDENSEDSPID